MSLKPEIVQLMNKFGCSRTPFLFIIDFEGSNKSLILPLSELENQQQFLYNFNGISNTNVVKYNLPKEVQLKKYPISFESYQHSFNYCVSEINYGNSYLLNLTFPTVVDLNLSLREVFDYSKAKYKFLAEKQFVCFSPETFVKIENGIISSNPMKGTISADLPSAATQILNNKKEYAEHATIVDLIRNDLNRVAKKVTVEQFRYLDTVTTNDGDLLQVSSKIIGQLPKDYHKQLGNIFEELLPAGSITGAPKKKTIEIIKNAEGYERGFYTGICGYFDGQNVDSGVMIRYIENINGQYIFKSGGGITSQSNAKAEYQELIDKVYVPIRND